MWADKSGKDDLHLSTLDKKSTNMNLVHI
jgi:hypothetical protein